MSDVRVRVALLHGPASPDRDGVSDYVAHLVPALQDLGVDARSVAVAPRTSFPSPLDWLAAAPETARQVRRLHPAVVHVQFAPAAFRFSGVPGAVLPTLLPRGVPLVTTVHEYGWWSWPRWVPERAWRALEGPRVWDRETGRLLASSAAVVCTNERHAGGIRRRIGRPAGVIPLAANVAPAPVAATARETRAALGVPADRTVLAFFGFVHPVKGLRYVIEALPGLRERGLDPHLLVVGGFTSQALPKRQADAFRAGLEQLGRRCGVSDRVTFTGHLPEEEVSAALQAADIGVLPFTEGVTTKSGALLTLLGHGLPTVVTQPDEPDDRLRDGENVLVIPRRRSGVAVAETLHRLAGDRELRDRLSEAGRAVAARHAWPEVAARHRAVYHAVLGCAGA